METEARVTGDVAVGVISDFSRMRTEEVASCVKALVKDSGVVARVLNRRCVAGLKVPPERDFEVRTASGEVVARILRNRLDEQDFDAFLRPAVLHKEHSEGWAQGCEVGPSHTLYSSAR